MPSVGDLLRIGHLDLVALEEDLTGVEVQVARECLDHGGFAGTVVADQGDHLAGVDVEVRVVQGSDMTEAPRQTASFKDGGHRAVTSVYGRARPSITWTRLSRRRFPSSARNAWRVGLVHADRVLPDGTTGDETAGAALVTGNPQRRGELVEGDAGGQHGPRALDRVGQPAA